MYHQKGVWSELADRNVFRLSSVARLRQPTLLLRLGSSDKKEISSSKETRALTGYWVTTVRRFPHKARVGIVFSSSTGRTTLVAIDYLLRKIGIPGVPPTLPRYSVGALFCCLLLYRHCMGCDHVLFRARENRCRFGKECPAVAMNR